MIAFCEQGDTQPRHVLLVSTVFHLDAAICSSLHISSFQGTGTPEYGGLLAHQLLQIIRGAASTHRGAGFVSEKACHPERSSGSTHCGS